MKVGLLTESRYLQQRMPVALYNVLTAQDIDVDIIDSSQCLFDSQSGILLNIVNKNQFDLNAYDFIVPRTRSALGLSLLQFVESLSIPVINSYQRIRKVRNKAMLAVEFSSHGIRSPLSWQTDDIESLFDIPEDLFPLIVKPVFGDNAKDIEVVQSKRDIESISWPYEWALVQQYIPNDGKDIKIYVCGEHLFAVEKDSPLRKAQDGNSTQVSLSMELENIARHCGDIFQLDIFGVDLVRSGKHLFVIEVNDFPNFTSVDQAPEIMAKLIRHRLDTIYE